MVKTPLVFAVLCLSLGAASCTAAGKCTEASEHVPALCPTGLPRIAAVDIEKNGEKSPIENDPTVECSAFKITPKGVQLFFEKALETDARGANHTLKWSPCSASGKLTFTDGRKANWYVSQFQKGELDIDGEEKRMYLYCPDCKYSPFIWDTDEEP